MFVIAQARANSFFNALRSSPERGCGVVFRATIASFKTQNGRQQSPRIFLLLQLGSADFCRLLANERSSKNAESF
jgi:hypothetical protein